MRSGIDWKPADSTPLDCKNHFTWSQYSISRFFDLRINRLPKHAAELTGIDDDSFQFRGGIFYARLVSKFGRDVK